MRSGKLSPTSGPSLETGLQPRSPCRRAKTCREPARSSRTPAHATHPLREFGRRRCPAAKHCRMTSAGTLAREPRRGRRVSNKPNSLSHGVVGGTRRVGHCKPRALHEGRRVVAERPAGDAASPWPDAERPWTVRSRLWGGSRIDHLRAQSSTRAVPARWCWARPIRHRAYATAMHGCMRDGRAEMNRIDAGHARLHRRRGGGCCPANSAAGHHGSCRARRLMPSGSADGVLVAAGL